MSVFPTAKNQIMIERNKSSILYQLNPGKDLLDYLPGGAWNYKAPNTSWSSIRLLKLR